jgi:hypothetical protein
MVIINAEQKVVAFLTASHKKYRHGNRSYVKKQMHLLPICDTFFAL